MKTQLLEFITHLTDDIYDVLRGRYPEFVIASFADQVRIANKIQSLTMLVPYEQQLVETFWLAKSDGTTETMADWAERVTTLDGHYQNARAALSSLHEQGVEAITATPVEGMDALLDALHARASEAVPTFTQDENIAATINASIGSWYENSKSVLAWEVGKIEAEQLAAQNG